MISLKSKQSGFTIVELLIVIVVIGILAALVITTFAGIQKKARDTERTTDVKAIHSQLEAYQAQFGKYPTLANLQDNAWITSDNGLKGLDAGATHDPKGAAGNNVAGAIGTNAYAYVATPANCDNAAPATDCATYVLTATLEGGGTFAQASLN